MEFSSTWSGARLLLDVLGADTVDGLRRGLESLGWQVMVLSSEAELLTLPLAVDALLLSGGRNPTQLSEILTKMAQASRPVLILILADEHTDLRLCLQLGATDFVMAPWSATEIHRRLSARMELAPLLNLGPCVVELRHARVVWPGQVLPLTPTEVRILSYLSRRVEHPVTREDLLLAVWGYQVVVDTRAVALAMSRLRRKIEQDPDQPRYLLTVYGVGYRLVLRPTGSMVDNPRPLPFGLPGVSRAWVGREEQTEEVLRLLEGGCRVLVLHGPGGIGKTRLAVEVGRRLLGQREIRFFDASELPHGASLLPTLARGVQASPRAGVVKLEHICQAIRGRNVLLILDGVERQLEEVGQIIEALGEVQGVDVLLTSRVHLPHPQVDHILIPPLPIAAGVELFIQVATDSQPSLMVEGVARSDIEAIVRGVDSIPLAIKLAASRVQLLGLTEIWRRLERPLDLLGGPAQPPSRHQSLHRTLEDSWILLGPDLQRALVACVTFRGGFDLEAAEQVLPPDLPSVADHLQILVDHSLVQAHMGPLGPRCSIFESVRHYLEAKVGVEEAKRRHARHFAAMAHQLAQDVFGPDMLLARGQFQLEHPNLLAAFGFVCQTSPEEAAAFALELCQLYWPLGEPGALELIKMVPAAISPSMVMRLRVQRTRYLLRLTRLVECRSEVEAILAATHGEQWLECRLDALQLLSTLDVAEGRLLAPLERSPQIVALLDRTGQRRLKAVHLIELSSCYRRIGQLKLAMILQEQALELAQQEGALWNEMLIRSHIGLVRIQLGDLLGAAEAILPQVQFYRDSGDQLTQQVELLNLAVCYVDSLRLEQAHHTLSQVAPLVERVGGGGQHLYLGCVRARLAITEGKLGEAATLLGQILGRGGYERSHLIGHVWTLKMWICHLCGTLQEALGCVERALASYNPVGNPLEVGRLLLRKVVVMAELGQLDGIDLHWEEALKLLLPMELDSVSLLLGLSHLHLEQLGMNLRLPPLNPSRPAPELLGELEVSTGFSEVRWACRLVRQRPGGLV